jgi:hypothetical protein
MKNTIKKGKIHYLIINRGVSGYLGICKEFGFVEEAKSEKELVKRLFRSSILLLDTVQKYPNLEPSLNVRPPLKYWMLFYIVPFWSSVSSIFQNFNGNIKLLTQSIYHPMINAC